MRSFKSCVGLVSAVLLVAAAACSSSDVDESSPSTTTPAPTTTEATTAGGEAKALDWSIAFGVPEPFDIVEVVWANDRFYALGNDWGKGFFAPSAIWTSEDGSDWIDVDPSALGADALVQKLVPSDNGILALGFLPDGDGHAATAWYSEDGNDWEVSDLGYVVEPSAVPFTTSILWYRAAAAGPAGAVVAADGALVLDHEATQQAIAEVLPAEVAGIDHHRLVVRSGAVQAMIGPFVVFDESLTALGLTDIKAADRMTDSPAAEAERDQVTFSTADLERWTKAEGWPVDAEYGTLTAIGDEYLAAAASGGPTKLYASTDGQEWELVGDLPEGSAELFAIGERLITRAWQGSEQVTLVSDDHGRSWDEAPGPSLSVSWISAAGPAGVLAVGTEGEVGWGPTEPGVVDVDRHTVTLDMSAQEFTVTDAGGTILFSSSLVMDDPMWGWGFTPPVGLTFDHATETATIVDPDGGEPLLTLDFADLDRLESAMVSYGGDLLTFSPDGEQWTVAPLAEPFGADAAFGSAAVGADRVVAVVGRTAPEPFADAAIWVGIPVAGEAVPPAPVAVELPEVVMGGPILTWEKVADLEQGFETMAMTGSGVWAVASSDGSEPGAVWHSSDGLAWNTLDISATFGNGAEVERIGGGGPGLVAVGEWSSGDTREVVVWTSTDGTAWTASPTGTRVPGLTDAHIEHVAAGPSGAVVLVAMHEPGLDYDRLEPNVQSALPAGLRDYATGMGVMIDPWNVSVSVGPFQVYSESVENLDVDRDLFDAYERGTGSGPPQTSLLATSDYDTWTPVEDWPGAGQPILALAVTDTGYVALAYGYGPGPTLLTSPDGIEWMEAETTDDLGMIGWIESPDDGPLVLVGEVRGRRAIFESLDDGTTWSAVTALPDGAWEARTGALGLLAWGEHEPEDGDGWWDPSTWEPTVVESDGYTLSATEGTGGLSITDTAGNIVLTADLHASSTGPWLELPDVIVADHERSEFTVLDPDGAVLMTIPYRGMQDAFEATQGEAGPGPDTFIGYSTDGRIWSEQPLAEVAGTGGWIGQAAVGDDFAVIVVYEMDESVTLWRGTR